MTKYFMNKITIIKVLLYFTFPLILIYWLVQLFYINTHVKNQAYFQSHSNTINLLHQPCDGEAKLKYSLKQQNKFGELYVFKTVYKLNHHNPCKPKSAAKEIFIEKSIIA